MHRSVLLFAVFALAASPVLAADAYEVDVVHSAAMFKVTHFGAGHTYGRFNDISGTYVLDAAAADKSSVDITIKTGSVDSNHKKRDDHLRSPDFFNAKQFPTLKFKSKKVTPSADGGFKVLGDLTLHGVTKPVTIDVVKVGEGKDPFGGYRSGYETTFKVKRSDFDMKFMLDGVSDEVEITVALEGVRKDTKK